MQKFIIISILLLTLASMVDIPGSHTHSPQDSIQIKDIDTQLNSNELANQLGDQIQKIRSEKGFTPKSLANILNTTVSDIQEIENGSIIPSESFLSDFQYALGCRLYLGS